MDKIIIDDLDEELYVGYEYTYVTKKQKEVKCECGAEKCKTTHARWCPLFEED